MSHINITQVHLEGEPLEANTPWVFENPESPGFWDYAGTVRDANGLVWYKFEDELERNGKWINGEDADFPLTAVERD